MIYTILISYMTKKISDNENHGLTYFQADRIFDIDIQNFSISWIFFKFEVSIYDLTDPVGFKTWVHFTLILSWT